MQSHITKQNLLWITHPLRELLRLSWPICVSMLSYSMMTLVDTIFVGRLGAAELAGVGLAGTLAFVMLCFSIGLLRGSKALVSQAVGARRLDEVAPLLMASVAVALTLGVVATLVGQLMAHFVVHLAASPAAGEYARTYLRIRALGAPAMLLFVALREVRYGLGDSNSSMYASVIANVANIVLCWLFVVHWHWGVGGAAWATVIAHLVELGTLFARAYKRADFLGQFSWTHLRAVLKLGGPTGLQFLLEVGAFALLATLIAGFGDIQMAAHQIVIQLIHFSFLPAFSVGEAAAVMAGQAIGARRDELVTLVSRKALRVVSFYTAFCTFVFAVFGRELVLGFSSDEQLVTTAVHLVYVAAVFQMFDGAQIVARCTLRGAGDVRYPAVVGVVTSWVCTPPLCWLLGSKLGLGALGGWIGLCVEIIAGTLILWWRLERNGWRAAAAQTRNELESRHAEDGNLAVADAA